MAIRIVRLGSERFPNEGLRIGTVRRPPRGVPKSKFSSGNWYDVWLPNLSPKPETVKLALTAENERQWAAFVKRYRREMASPKTAEFSICWQRSHIRRTSRSAAIATMRRAAIGRFFGSCWSSAAPKSYKDHGRDLQ